jgi:hypothetical protein
MKDMGPAGLTTPRNKKPVTEKLTKVDPKILINHSKKVIEAKKAIENKTMRLIRAPKPEGVRDMFKSKGFW